MMELVILMLVEEKSYHEGMIFRLVRYHVKINFFGIFGLFQ